jgi:hypothetical protein
MGLAVAEATRIGSPSSFEEPPPKFVRGDEAAGLAVDRAEGGGGGTGTNGEGKSLAGPVARRPAQLRVRAAARDHLEAEATEPPQNFPP